MLFPSASSGPGVPLAEFAAQRAERPNNELDAGADVETTIVRYPHPDHGFRCDARPSDNDAAATDAWARTLAWLDGHLAPGAVSS